MPRARRVDVELGDLTPVGATDPADAPHPGGRRRWWWWLAVPVAAVLALVGGQLVTDQRERTRLGALAALPGVVAPLDGPPEVAWQPDRGTLVGGAVRVGPVLVARHVADDGGALLVGLDATTGERRWELDVVGEPAPAPPWWPDTGGCAAVPDGSGHVACLLTADDAGTDRPPAPRLVVVDAADGTVQVDRELPAWVQWPTLRGDDVLLVGDVDGTLHVASQGLRDGTEHWSTTAEGSGAGTTAAAALLDDGTLAVARGGAVTLVSTDGAVLRTVGDAPQGGLTGQVATRGVVVSRTLGAVLVGSGSTTTVVTPTGEVRLDGSAAPVVVDDGSVPGLVLTRTPGLQAWDARDGSPRWGAPVVDAQDVTVLEGRVHVGTSAAVVTFDGATGEELWRVARPTASGTPLTDGRHLLVLARQGGRHTTPYDLVALHVADGSEAWRVPLPPQTWLTAAAGLLVAVSYDTDALTETHRVLR
ncbi:hypothetical protein Cfla_0064 [Cellulomonas flavigena DSM 20109]|uniref:Pyrrolo-quinoline quinone repeat domain-containing protein n=1 Tax=Cellulomonas flavigena (strain ATCC 482 / DSM 20109 / BCRC 11376 / JCM 18109 / NBRC 3775 / NCIMB 8073 / NRS 134) TaxID=446466 RepID=D5UFM5_CELFN|nr:PQQ-binding-like beta-propeller repeat protein [Cellulomonas flavigena]ADG72984.1 hypothetical protein Cfla_0064 [Cellulomonas flavigena DSM 20109]